MLLTILEKYNTTTNVFVKCESCGVEWKSKYGVWKNSKIREKYGKDFCVKCRYKDGRNPNKNKKWYYNPETNECRVFENDKIPKGFVVGNIFITGEKNPQSTKNIMKKFKCTEEEAKKYNPFYGKKHSEKTIENIANKNRENVRNLTKDQKREKFGCGVGLQIKGKTNIEFYGKEKAKQMLENQYNGFEIFKNSMSYEEFKNHYKEIGLKISKTLKKNKTFSGDKNPSSLVSVSKRFDCSVEDASKYMPMYGKKQTDEAKRKCAIAHYGKPPSKNSGFGFSGKYKGFNFRSSYELSFLIDVLKYAIEIESAENSFNIPYKLNNKNRTYRPDFIVDNYILIEIKPEIFKKNAENIVKFEAANKFCQQNNLKFVILTEKDLTLIKKQDIINMYKNNEIILFKNTLKRLGLNEC